MSEAPEIFVDCHQCGGEGHTLQGTWVYETSCGFGHDDVQTLVCQECNGSGGYICEAPGDLT